MSGGACEVENIPMAECIAYVERKETILVTECVAYGSHSVSQSSPGGVIEGQQNMEGENGALEADEDNYEPIPN